MDTSLLDRAIVFAVQCHSGVERRGKGFPYIVHPMEAMAIAATMTDDQEILAAAALHDVVEDTDVTLDDLKDVLATRAHLSRRSQEDTVQILRQIFSAAAEADVVYTDVWTSMGMEAERERTITLMKETQCMPGSPDGTILIHSLRYAGELLPLAPYAHRIEFIGDSLTSGEGTLAPRDNQEWISAWFSARANYAYIAARMVNAEPRILSQSGFGVAWDCEHNPERNMVDGYEKIAGVLFGEKAEQRGCQKAYDFASWPADVVCIRLATNDSGGMNLLRSFPADGPAVTAACLRLIRVVRKNNPGASIVWILPDSHCHPELARAAVEQARAEGLEDIYAFTLPDYTPEDYGARSHPNAAWNQKAGNLLGAWLREMLPE